MQTAIICTMSPALSHVEQSRNTLSFATSAKEVTNTAEVNMVVEDKHLVKHLQKEVARLEAELHSPEPSSSICLRSLPKEKDLKIRQMEREMNELKRQRDIAESLLEQERRSHKEPKSSKECGPSCQVAKCLSFATENEDDGKRHHSETLAKWACGRQLGMQKSATFTDPSMLVHEIQKIEMCQRQLGEEASHALELLRKEVGSHRLGSKEATESIAKLLSEIKDMHGVTSVSEEIEIKDKASLKEVISRLNSEGNNIATLQVKLENVQKSIDRLVDHFPTGKEIPDDYCGKKEKDSSFHLKAIQIISHIQ